MDVGTNALVIFFYNFVMVNILLIKLSLIKKYLSAKNDGHIEQQNIHIHQCKREDKENTEGTFKSMQRK